MNSTAPLYDLAILGGGPAGAGATVYATRKRLKTIVITRDWLGQSNVSEKIENWVGTVALSGLALSQNLEEHAKAYAKDTTDFKDGESVKKVEKIAGGFSILTDKGNYQAKTVLVTTGSHRRKLEVPGADVFEHKGVTYCATCDGPLFTDQDVVVIGGGNSAFESAAQLLSYCKTVTLLQRSAEYRADPGTIEKVLSNPKMKAYNNIDILEVTGEKFVTAIVFRRKEMGETKETITLPTTGIFVEIGAVPTTDHVQGLVKTTESGYVMVDPRTQQTSILGIWAAGDCTDGLYHQNNIAVGDAVKALEDIYNHLHTK